MPRAVPRAGDRRSWMLSSSAEGGLLYAQAMGNFAICGVGGVIAPRHLKAIRDTGNRLVAAADVKDSVGVLDHYSFDVPFFTDMDRFDRHLEKLRRGTHDERVQYLTVCTPNYLHDAHCRLGLRVKADVICEKPVVINPWNLDALQQLEAETGHRVWTVLQLRAHDRLTALRSSLDQTSRSFHDVELTYVTARGPWYDVSWKGQTDKSGGVPTNIGIHLFDLLIWLFGAVTGAKVHLHEQRRMAGFLELERARVRWFLSVDRRDIPPRCSPEVTTFRSICVDGEEVEFSNGFAELHTRVYEMTLAGNGFGLADARPSIELAHRLRHADVSAAGLDGHSALSR